MPSRNSTKAKAPVHSRLGNEKVSRDDSELEYIGVFKVYEVIYLLIHNFYFQSSNKGRIDGGRKDNRRPPPPRRKKKDFQTEAKVLYSRVIILLVFTVIKSIKAVRHSSPEGELEIDEGFQVTDDFVDLT